MADIQSAIYLTGNKRTIVGDILPHLQDGKRDKLIDLFTGSGTIILKCKSEGLFSSYTGNDMLKQLIGLHKYLRDDTNIDTLTALDRLYENTEEGYYKMRDAYNANPSDELLLLLHYRSNNNMIRFNRKGGFNMPYGKRHRFDVPRVLTHRNLMQGVDFTCSSYTVVVESLLKEDRLDDCTVYLDPPYDSETSTAVYNDGWSWMDADNVRAYMLKLVDKGAKVVYSNVFHNRGIENTGLIRWCDQHKDMFDVYHLDKDYSNSSFRKSDKRTDEVLIVSK